jgi:hypothetical protein
VSDRPRRQPIAGSYDTMALFTTTVKTPLRSSPALWAADLK